MIFQWHHVNNINPNISLDQFEETVIFQEEYATDYYEIQYPGLILNIILNRKVNYHLINSYIPSCLFVTVAWLSLFVNPEAIPGRISMVMMTLLTLMAMFSGIRQSTPKVSTLKKFQPPRLFPPPRLLILQLLHPLLVYSLLLVY